jgi:hypothetical protein
VAARDARGPEALVSSPSPSPAKRAKFDPSLYCSRPSDAEANSPLPKFGSWVQQAMIESDGVIYRAMESLKPVFLPGGLERGGQGRLLRNASITKIAAATALFTYGGDAMPRRTVAHRLEAMAARGIIIPWEAETRAKTSPVGTSWRMPNYDEILGAWAADPAIGTVPPRAFYVFGKGKRFFSPAEMVSWGLDHAAAARLPNAQASRVSTGIQDEAAAAAPATENAAPPAPRAEAVEIPAAEEVDLEPLKDALIEVCGAATIDDAKFVWARVVRESGKNPLPPVEDMATDVRVIGRNWKQLGSRKPITHGLVRDKIGGYAAAWQKNRRQRETLERKQAAAAFDDRVNLIADSIRQRERGYDDDEAREFFEGIIRDAAPEQVAAAMRLIAAIKARSA